MSLQIRCCCNWRGRSRRCCSLPAFTAFPFAPPPEGKYIIEHVMLVSAAIPIGATVRREVRVAE